MARALFSLLVSGVVGMLFILPLQQRALAFDTGHHFDLTRLVLKRQGLGFDAINSALLANWLTDYYSSSPAIKNPLLKSALVRLHFDNLGSRKEIDAYYQNFNRNLKALVEEAAAENDRIKMLIAVGMAHHIIQDFYAHSNWTNLYARRPNGQFDVDLYPRPTVVLKGKLQTGTWPPRGEISHGNYKSGMNKDSPIRPGWENAFVMAHAATWQMTNRIRSWAENVRPGFWEHTGSLNLTNRNRWELLRDLSSAHSISMWVRAKVLGLPASDGHWKGNQTGNAARFHAATQQFTTWKNSFLARQFRETDTPTRMALDLDNPVGSKTRQLLTLPPEFEFEGHAIVVKIHALNAVTPTLNGLPIGARIYINGETYVGRIFAENTDFSDLKFPAWHELHIEREESENSPGSLISIQLFALENGNLGREILIDTNPDPAQSATLFEVSEKSGLMDRLRQKLSRQSTGLLRSSGAGPIAAEITYSVEVHEID